MRASLLKAVFLLILTAPLGLRAAATISSLSLPSSVVAGQDFTVSFNTGAGCTYVGIALSPTNTFTCPNTGGYPYPWVLHDTVHYASGYSSAPDYRGMFGGGLNTGCSAQSLTFSVRVPPDAPATVYLFVFAASTSMTIWGQNSCSYDMMLTSPAITVTGRDTTLRVNLLMQNATGGEPGNVYESVPSIANWGLWPVDSTRFCVRKWVYDAATPAITALSGSHYILATNTGTNWGPAAASPWTSSVSYLGTGSTCDATHKANWMLQACYTGATRYIPGNGGFLKPGNDGDYAGLWWNGGGTFTKTDDYSQASALGAGFANRIDEYHYGLYDSGSLVCEYVSWSTQDPLTGQEPCGISNCVAPTPTQTPTASYTPTLSPTPTLTWTNTPSPAPTQSPTPTPRLELTKTVDRTTVMLGDTLTYCLYWNNDSASSQHLVLWDTLNPVLSYVGSSPAASQSGQLLIWDFGMIAPGASASVCFGAKVVGLP